jgi:hypothetical protein
MITERRILKGVTSNCAFLRNACELRISCSGACDGGREAGRGELIKQRRVLSPLRHLKPIADSISLVAQSFDTTDENIAWASHRAQCVSAVTELVRFVPFADLQYRRLRVRRRR